MEITTNGNTYPLINGIRELTKDDFSLDDDAGEWDDCIIGWSYYLSSVGNMDEIFGTNVETFENDDYINVYAHIDCTLESVQDFLDVSLWKSGGDIDYFNYQLSDREKKILHLLILEHESSQMENQLLKAKVELSKIQEGC